MTGPLERVNRAANALARELNDSKFTAQCGSFHLGFLNFGNVVVKRRTKQAGGKKRRRYSFKRLEDNRLLLRIASSEAHFPIGEQEWLKGRLMHHLQQQGLEPSTRKLELLQQVEVPPRHRGALKKYAAIPATHSFHSLFEVRIASPAKK